MNVPETDTLKQINQDTNITVVHEPALAEFADKFDMANSMFEKIDSDISPHFYTLNTNEHPRDTLNDRLSKWFFFEKYMSVFPVTCDIAFMGNSYREVTTWQKLDEIVSEMSDELLAQNHWNRFDSFYTERRKVNINDKFMRIYEEYSAEGDTIPEFEFFIELRKKAVAIAEEFWNKYNKSEFDSTQYNMVVIEYRTPFAFVDSENFKQQRFNNAIWARPHCDENYGGLHLGESEADNFYVINPNTGEYQYVKEFADPANAVWMWGAYESDHGFIPTEHGVYTEKENEKYNGNRYSIILDVLRPEDL